MRQPRNRPRSRHKIAAWEAEQQRRDRCGLRTDGFIRSSSRSLSLRAASFKEAVPERSEFPTRGKFVPVRTVVRSKAEKALVRTNDPLMISVVFRRKR